MGENAYSNYTKNMAVNMDKEEYDKPSWAVRTFTI